MRILIVPIAYINRSLSPVARTSFLASDLADAGFEVAICGNKEYRQKETTLYKTPTPPESDIPAENADFESFGELIYRAGFSSYEYLTSEINAIMAAIKAFQPDIIYSETSIAGIISAKIANIPCLTSYHPCLTKDTILPIHLEGINEALSSNNLPQVINLKSIFNMTLFKFIDSCAELAPCEETNVVYTGFSNRDDTIPIQQAKVLIDLDGCPINKQSAIKVLSDAFLGSKYNVIIKASNHVLVDNRNVHTKSSTNIQNQLRSACVFIHSGSSTNMLNSLLYRVPQIIIPSDNTYCRYNAQVIAKNALGFYIRKEFYDVKHIYEAFRALLDDPKYLEYTKATCERMLSFGGNQLIISYLNVIEKKIKNHVI